MNGAVIVEKSTVFELPVKNGLLGVVPVGVSLIAPVSKLYMITR